VRCPAIDHGSAWPLSGARGGDETLRAVGTPHLGVAVKHGAWQNEETNVAQAWDVRDLGPRDSGRLAAVPGCAHGYSGESEECFRGIDMPAP
jgi:hypothetical protein